MPQQIRIVARDSDGKAVEYLHFARPIMAELAFYAITHDEAASHYRESNWYLEVKQYSDEHGKLYNDPGPGHLNSEWICVQWHCPNPNGFVPQTGHVENFNVTNTPPKKG